jgi:transcription antitermination factor NusG
MCEETRVIRRKKQADRVVRYLHPLFDNYLFVVPNNLWSKIRSTRGVARVLMDGAAPARFPQSAIDAILARMNRRGYVELVPDEPEPARLTPGQRVRIQDGLSTLCDGIYLGADRQRRVIVMVSLFGRKVRASVERKQIAA